MVLEYAQMLSTAHRILDGKHYRLFYLDDNRGREVSKKVWLLENEIARVEKRVYDDSVDYSVVYENKKCYAVAHANHPQSIWVRSNASNYAWMYSLLQECLKEYTFRYGRKHSVELICDFLRNTPRNIDAGSFYEPPITMPEEYKLRKDGHLNVIESYKNFYILSKVEFAKWTKRQPPQWFKDGVKNYDESLFVRKTRVLAEQDGYFASVN